MRKIIERALRRAGRDLGEVREAGNGPEALVEVQKGSLDIILSDIFMVPVLYEPPSAVPEPESPSPAAIKEATTQEPSPEEPPAPATETTAPQEFVPAAPSSPRRSGLRWWIPVTVALVLAAATLSGWHTWFPKTKPPAPQEGRQMLAVLPFENLTGDPAQEYFSDGLTEEMIGQLGRLDPAHLGVIGRNSVMRYKSNREPPRQSPVNSASPTSSKAASATMLAKFAFPRSSFKSATRPPSGPATTIASSTTYSLHNPKSPAKSPGEFISRSTTPLATPAQQHNRRLPPPTKRTTSISAAFISGTSAAPPTSNAPPIIFNKPFRKIPTQLVPTPLSPPPTLWSAAMRVSLPKIS
jgi:hypothetical protein